ncbi:MAG: hypothetical protein GEU26_06385 [Nitrososphaeraceae archaeon]|nr:hypothetical protein [Nitrososphaeraceae archaeon]
MFCRNGCETNLHFETSIRSESGKLIPLEDDGSPHNCPNRRRYDPGNENGIEKKIEKMDKNLLKIMLDVQFIRMNLEGQKTLDQT